MGADEEQRQDEVEARRIRRRDLLAKGAVAGGILWAAPVIESVTNQAAAASAGQPTIYVYLSNNLLPKAGLINGYAAITLSDPNTAVCTNSSPPGGTCPTCQFSGAFFGNLLACGQFNFVASQGAVTVTPGLGAPLNILPRASGSFMICGGKCFRATGPESKMVFDCANPGVAC